MFVLDHDGRVTLFKDNQPGKDWFSDTDGWLECESCSKCWHVVCAGYDVNEIDHAFVFVCNECS